MLGGWWYTAQAKRVVLPPEILQSSISDVFFLWNHYQGGQTHLVKVLLGLNYFVIMRWLSLPLHLGISKVAQAPDLPYGVLATLSP